ncbi:phosphomannomutase/phosphoglucomutase [Nakamurella multipartita]|uniref:Phosphomannomutase n=1 Tax=Nakamurella multipartita (strain ATCC 700099 / DSM 44233 / CIP 104796 / JCM 9543 / NBRC 105858 / Y-104) TaxID=479431 RepID=C8XIJ2_NAKMY|nr:phosphomannomutase/phosphoglucomutase [Nakamurella multipartita]ACV80457.1 Phosphomannomutase [Nakamurella multipartita DSM 44233]HOZ57982.1 phosphomannomutase/phosphoglucomutase [Nakamurella multipartita]
MAGPIAADGTTGTDESRLTAFVKAYDVRGLVGSQLTPQVTRAIGYAFARFLSPDASAVVVAYDMRESSPELAGAFAEGVTTAGLDVVMAGLGSTDMLYFAAGHLNLPGAMFTASHNPASYNGIKMCLAGAVPISLDTGLALVRDEAQDLLDAGWDAAALAADRVGVVTEQDLLSEYAAYLLNLVDLTAIRPLHVVVDAGNGMAGYTVPAVFAGLPLRVDPMYFELDGSFPNHEANPLDPANLVDLQARVREVGADIGLAFDGDADRCFVVDERGEPVSPSAVTALVATRELGRHPGATILYNLISSRAVPEIVGEAGGQPVRTRVGHSFIKAEMARTGAVFGGEHSAHYYFADFFRADTGMLAALHVLAALGGQPRPLSEFTAEFDRYANSGEINSTVADAPAKLAEIRGWAAEHGAEVDELDGITVTLDGGRWFNVRSSNTEPLLRLNVEAPTAADMAALRDEILALIRA